MRIHRAILAFLITVVCHTLLYSQTKTHVEHITERDGLSYRWVLDIMQDHRGFLWFGTYDGLNRYDGQSFVTYKHSANDTNSLSNSRIYHLTEDASGNIWTYSEDLVFNQLDLSSGDRG